MSSHTPTTLIYFAGVLVNGLLTYPLIFGLSNFTFDLELTELSLARRKPITLYSIRKIRTPITM